MHHGTRGAWKIASVLVALIIPMQQMTKRRKNYRPYEKPLTPDEMEFIRKFRFIMTELRMERQREQQKRTNTTHR